MPPYPPSVVRDIFMQLVGFPMIYRAYVGQGNTYKSKNGATVHIVLKPHLNQTSFMIFNESQY